MDPNARVVNTITAMRYLRTFDDDGLDLLMVGMIFEMARRRHETPTALLRRWADTFDARDGFDERWTRNAWGIHDAIDDAGPLDEPNFG